ncbi:DsbA family protein, FrnE-like subfamily [Arcobacter venerupis]|uniref:DsbA family protein, FrnE-like subfamily n=1 Tax=Arcobacter venerupis TaxID=1054033 RepID=A0AAE7B7P9_9BACT|nr:DsbA family protein [Arcobacter venerupis]QKF66928.1 DsbA family protein, FrnE-like subfamily [Arcobacter venerupis]RWS50121.1 DsbA family protein [Arcobacter venerupis]
MIYSLYHVHDPMCSWCYAFKPTLDELRKYLADNIKLVHVVGGLAKHSDEIMPKEMQEKIEAIWYEIEDVVGTKFNHDFWKECKPRRSTYLACQATILARDEDKEDEMIEAIQEAYYQKALNPSDASTLIELAKNIGMDEKKFEEDLKSQKIEEDLQNELNFRRSLNVRSFPSLILKSEKELYPINIKYNDYESMLNQINNIVKNSHS